MPSETPLTDAAIAARLAELPGWSHEGGTIRRTFRTDGWPTTLMLVNAIGFYAEAADHHPDLEVSWGRIRVQLRTHSARGITDKDFALGRVIEAAALWRPPADGPLRGTPRPFVSAPDTA